MMKKIFLICLMSVCVGNMVNAQLVSDERAMYDRMDRLERDITLLQRKIYKGGEVSSSSTNQQTAVQSATNGNSLEHLYMKIADLESSVASLTAQVEELSHSLSEVQNELKRTNADMDLRFSEIEKNKEAEKKVVAKESTLKVNNEKKKSEKTSKEEYEAAYKLLNEQKYAQAQVALEDFIEKYPKDSLAGNAQYWLGETFYVRELYEPAAVAFTKGFKEYKNGPKGSDSLFKLGLTMEKLNKKKEACIAYKNIKKEFPKASESLLSKTKKQMDKLGCNK